MENHYHDPKDVTQLKRMRMLAPQEFAAWLGLEKIIAREDGAIPAKYRQLIAMAVALKTQCPYCIEAHVRAAKKAGATPEELAETSFLTAALAAGAAAMHGAMAFKFFGDDEAENKAS
jgi:AhpD family alkylhydroperoxidase